MRRFFQIALCCVVMLLIAWIICTGQYVNAATSLTRYINVAIQKQLRIPKGSAGKITQADDVTVLGEPRVGGKYAVFGCKLPIKPQDTYAFYLPLTVRAWKRVGFESVAILTGSEVEWRSNSSLGYVIDELTNLGAIVVFLKCLDKNAVMLSQTSRVFASTLVHWKDLDGTYLVTSDVDLWPLKFAPYILRTNKKILSLNSECCGSFAHKGKHYKMLPLSNVGMSVSTWRKVMSVNNTIPRTAMEIVHYFGAELGGVAYTRVSKGFNAGWFMDQKMISIRVAQWTASDRIRRGMVDFRSRQPAADRIDRAFWNPQTLGGKVDSHLLYDGYTPRAWDQLKPLIKLMFNSSELSEIEHYHDNYLKLL